MNSHETAIAERLHDAADRIIVDADVSRVVEPRPTVVRRPRPRRRIVMTGVAVAGSAAALILAVWLPPETKTVETGPAGTAAPVDESLAPASVAAHVVSPPDWFGEPRGGYREGGLRTGRWVTMAIGQVSAHAVSKPIVISVFEGTYRLLDDAQTVTIDGTSRRSIRYEGWQALATEGSPTVVVSGAVDERTLAAVLGAVDMIDPSGEFSLRLRARPEGYDEVVPPRVLGPDSSPRRTLAGESGDVGINEVSDWTDALLAAAASGADLTAVELDGDTGWASVSPGSPDGPLQFLAWSPRPGVVFEITTDDMERPVGDLVVLALATTALDVDEWDRIYGD